MNDALHRACRPGTWGEFAGNDAVVASIQDMVSAGAQRSYLFIAPSGCGKTTAARLIAKTVGCANPREIDAASHTGIDAMRAVAAGTLFAIGAEPTVVIVDECHALSKAAWQALLKSVEEPPPGVWWIFCTTEASKVPATIKTRCAVYEFEPLDQSELSALADRVCAAARIELPDGVARVCVRYASGSPRRLLTAIERVRHASTKEDALRILRESPDDDAAAIDLCRALAKNKPWSRLMKIVEALAAEGVNGETIRRQVLAYFTKVALGARTEDDAYFSARVLAAFSRARTIESTGDKLTPIILALAEIKMRIGQETAIVE